MVIIRDPFLGKTNGCGGKEDADDDIDDAAEECCEEASDLRVDSYNFCDVVVHLHTTPSPNYIRKKGFGPGET